MFVFKKILLILLKLFLIYLLLHLSVGLGVPRAFGGGPLPPCWQYASFEEETAAVNKSLFDTCMEEYHATRQAEWQAYEDWYNGNATSISLISRLTNYSTFILFLTWLFHSRRKKRASTKHAAWYRYEMIAWASLVGLGSVIVLVLSGFSYIPIIDWIKHWTTFGIDQL